ncbi:MAG: hypothetical protein HKP41_11265 [Desulfobacterales bacterium]|nr:hypothetical protein [Desulfobacterales bacterium]
MSHYLVLLALIPLSCFELCKQIRFAYKNTICGIAIGLVIAPLGHALVHFTSVPVIGKFLGLIGLSIHLIHGWPGYACVMSTGLIEPSAGVTALQLASIHLLNGLLCGSIYALIGYVFDVRRRNRIFTRKIFPKLIY